jgi:ABC-type lipoprotein release transport system permease subunit
MMIPLKYNVRNLFVRWWTSLLTGVGFTLVVALLVVMLAFVQGMLELSKRSGPAGNVIILRDGANDEIFSDLDIKLDFTQIEEQPEVLKNAQGKALASREVYSIATQELPPKKPGDRPTYRFLQVRGVEDPEIAGQVHDLHIRPDGRWFDRTGTEVVLGEGIARLLQLDLGDTFQPKPELNWKVVGIIESRGSPFDSEIWAKREEVGRAFGKDNAETGQSFYTSVVVRTRDEATAITFAKELRDRVSFRINAMSERKYYEEMSKNSEMFLSAALFVAGIMAIGGMFGLMNTMFAAVSQRTKDIGVLRILGFSKYQIQMSFLLESMLLALVGGGLGLAVGMLCHGWEQTSFVTGGQGGGKTVVFKMIVNAYVVERALAFILGMGLLGGFLPALAAMRCRPLDALR